MPCTFFYNSIVHKGATSTNAIAYTIADTIADTIATQCSIGAKAKLHQLLSRGKVIGDCATRAHSKAGSTVAKALGAEQACASQIRLNLKGNYE